MGIKNSVGIDLRTGRIGTNHRSDLAYVQGLLNFEILFNSKMTPMVHLAEGVADIHQTATTILWFQDKVLGISPAIGLVKPGDKTMRALENVGMSSPSKPFKLAPESDRMYNKILQASHDDYLDLAFLEKIPGGEDYDERFETIGTDTEKRKAVFNLLSLPGTDDSFLPKSYLMAYIKETPPGMRAELIRAPKFKLAMVQEGGLKATTVDGVVKAFNTVFETLLRGLGYFHQQIAEGGSFHREEKGPEYGMYGALQHADAWLSAKKDDQKSIYSCLGLRWYSMFMLDN